MGYSCSPLRTARVPVTLANREQPHTCGGAGKRGRHQACAEAEAAVCEACEAVYGVREVCERRMCGGVCV